WEYRLTTPLIAPEILGSPAYQAIDHPLVIILSPPCDLESDHRSRFVTPPENEADLDFKDRDSIPTRMAYIRVCDVYEEATIRDAVDPTNASRRFPAKIWERVKGNQDVRYHRLPEGILGQEEIPPLYIDFRKEFSLPVEPLWKALQSGHIARFAVVPSNYVYDLFQRYCSFHSRIGQP
ncbi:MAG: hypothetical protein ACE5Q6_17595, partial [Dehalococcoidia bacterium]